MSVSQSVLYEVPAPAKVNLFLHVVGRRADGYHLLQTVFRFIDLADSLDFESRPDGRIQRVTPLPGVPSEQCLTVRAARALQQATGCTAGADIHLRKRIPQGGGLGGGSSDAATVLLALNRLWGTELTRQQLLQLALPLGADVPVFIFGQNAFAEGVGEQLQDIAVPESWYVVVQPSVEVATAAVFSHPNLTRDSKPVRILDLPDLRTAFFTSKQANSLVGGQVWQFGHNDLQDVVLVTHPQVAKAWQVAQQAVHQLGVKQYQVKMSGSGACLFIECANKQHATSIHATIAATIRSSTEAANAVRSVHICAGLHQHPLLHWAN